VRGGDAVAGTVRRITYKGGASAVQVTPDAAPDTALLLHLADPPPVGARVGLIVRDGWVIPEDNGGRAPLLP
jgi:hypothetical protein